jgi:hypothetical protein
MSWTISQLAAQQGYATTIYDADVMIMNNLGVTKVVTIATLKLAFQGTAFVLDATGANATIPAFKAIAANASGASGYANIDMVLQPKGTGALLASLPDNTVVGGNKRGSNAVDLQTSRSNAAQVAAGLACAILSGASNTIPSPASYGVIAGGQQNSITTSGSGIFMGGGLNNVVAAGNTHVLAGGSANNIQSGSSQSSVIGGGDSNVINTAWATIAGGRFNTLTGVNSACPGGYYGSDRGDQAYVYANGRFAAAGDAQHRQQVARRSTADATQSTLFADGATGFASGNLLELPNSSAFYFCAEVVARDNATGNCGVYEVKGMVKRGASAAATSVGGVVTTTIYEDAGAAAWDVTAQADTTNGALLIRVTGAAATTIKWVARIRTVEVVG